jgi:septal ring factor EnvC (AmiA/AmiB activator)
MFRSIYEWVANLLTATRELDQLRQQVREMRRDQIEIEKDLMTLRLELKAALDQERTEREKFMLQVQNLLLQWERRLPDAKPVHRRSRRKRRG